MSVTESYHWIRSILAVFAGIIIGSTCNMGLIQLGNYLVELPEGIIPNSMESLEENIHKFSFIHFVFPFLAHAIGTFVGAIVVAFIDRKQSYVTVYLIGLLFFVGGLMMVIQLPAPFPFEFVDLVFAYFPMAWLGLTVMRYVKS
jgi:hypothetical protein